LLSILIGTSVSAYFEVSGSPPAFDIGTAITVLVVWFLVANVLHPFIRLSGGRGDIYKTVAVFIFVISSLHVIWIPIFAIFTKIATETKVTLTYDYVVFFSLAGPRELGWGHSWLEHGNFPQIVEKYTETYILEREPEKEGTILLPVPKSVEEKLLK
jgi:hypothetical protein